MIFSSQGSGNGTGMPHTPHTPHGPHTPHTPGGVGGPPSVPTSGMWLKKEFDYILAT